MSYRLMGGQHPAIITQVNNIGQNVSSDNKSIAVTMAEFNPRRRRSFYKDVDDTKFKMLTGGLMMILLLLLLSSSSISAFTIHPESHPRRPAAIGGVVVPSIARTTKTTLIASSNARCRATSCYPTQTRSRYQPSTSLAMITPSHSSSFVNHEQHRTLSSIRLLLSADDSDRGSDIDDDDDVGDDDYDEEDWEPIEDDLLNELEDLADIEEDEDDQEEEVAGEDDDDDYDYYDDDDEIEDTKKIMATDDEFDEDIDELDDLDVYDEEDDDDDDDTYASEIQIKKSDNLDEEWQYEEEDEDEKSSTDIKTKKKFNPKSTDLSYMIDEDDDDPNLINLVPLQDDPDDPAYNARKADVEETIKRRAAELLSVQEEKERFENEGMESGDILSPVDAETLQRMMKELDFDGQNELDDIVDEIDSADVPYTSFDFQAALQEAQSETADEIAGLVDWNKVEAKYANYKEGDIPDDIEEELAECIDEHLQDTAYDVTKWLLYDLDFNVTNLILAAIKYNPDAPVIFHHWYPQLCTYSRYQYVRDRDFNFTFSDTENADVSELERYYAGFGYDEIPKLSPDETGAILLGEMDDEEIKMAAFEAWIKDVYNEELDKQWDKNDDELDDEDNVFSAEYVTPHPPNTPTWKEVQDDLSEWHAYWEDPVASGDEEAKEYRDYMGENHEYKLDPNNHIFEKEFCGLMVIACGEFDDDLDLAEKITTRFEEEFGPYKVYVETRVMSHARRDDNVFEIWLEGFEVDLLHSRRRATTMAKGWTGPAEVDDNQLDWLVNRVRWLTSDDARFSEPVREPEFEM